MHLLAGKIIQFGEYSRLDYEEVLKNSTTRNGLTLKVTGDCKMLDKIVENANNPNITLE